MNKLLSNNIEEPLPDFNYIDDSDFDSMFEEVSPEGPIYRHPSNRGSVINCGTGKIFIPDAKYRKKIVPIHNSYSYDHNSFNITNNPYINGDIIEDLYNSIKECNNSTEINDIIIKFNNKYREEKDVYISIFDYCNNIVVPKVGRCIIPNKEQLELIYECKDKLDEMDIHKDISKKLVTIFKDYRSNYIITNNFRIVADYNRNLTLQILSLSCSYENWEFIIPRKRALIPIIELTK